jgi:phosphotransferase system enzyme I (PtsI)
MLRNEEILVRQLRAILRAAVNHPVHVLLPMVSGPDDVRAARATLEKARSALMREGLPHAAKVPWAP